MSGVKDFEKGNSREKDTLSINDHELYGGDSSNGYQTATKLGWINRITASLNVEDKGIERVLEHERDPTEGIISAASMWFSANMVIASMALGMLGGGVWKLSFWDAFLTIIFFNLLGLLSVAFFSCFGPEFGLRQMVMSRMLLGNIAVRILSFINAVACVGWGAVNIMVSAQMLNMVNRPYELPPWVGCLLLILITIVVTFFGYKVVHLYEKWSWVPNVFVFLVIIARLKISGNFDAGGFTSGTATKGGVLSFGGAIFGFASGWTPYAADYTVFIRKNYPKWKIFVAVAIGLFIPLVFTMTLGAAVITGINLDETWMEYYTTHQSGGLIFCVLSVNSLGRFGEFCSVLIALSTVANNIPNMYSIAFCAQNLWSPLARIPRVLWSLVGNFLTLAICIPAYYHFETVMDNFMNLIAYYIAIYEAMALSEHCIWKKCSFRNYDVEGWNNKSRYPVGYAGLFGFIMGVVGAVLGMNQAWYQGVISKHVGGDPDIGFEFAAAFAFIGFNLIRPFEKKYTGR